MMKISNILLGILFCAAFCATTAAAQNGLDTGGNLLLNGTYYMRQVYYNYVPGQVNDLGETINVQGTITFSGTGNYTFTGSVYDSANSPKLAPNYTTGGTYTISSGGQGFISGVVPQYRGARIPGLVSHGIFFGSGPQNSQGSSSLFVAAPIGSTANNSTLTGTYTVAYFDATFPGDALFNMTADGNGGIGGITATEYTGSNSSPSSQSLTGVSYSFSNGAAQLKMGGARSSTSLLGGTELLYTSPDGSFIFGGAYEGFDMFVGVRAASSAPSNYAGLYYEAGLDMNDSAAASGYIPLESYFGAFQAFSGNIIGHKSMSTVAPVKYDSLSALATFGGSADFTYTDSYTLNSDGSSADGALAQRYVSSTDGTMRIGYGIGPYLGLSVAFQTAQFTGAGVYLRPTGIVNAASSAPVTTRISPGEFLTLYGSGLANTTATASLPYSSNFQGVQVMIDNMAAPIAYVSPTQISVVVPYLTSYTSAAQIVVINNGIASNTVSSATGLTSVGVFTSSPVGGTGYAAAIHRDFSVVSVASPARPGETVAVYLTGMGAVSLPVADGAPAPSDPLSYTTSTPLIYLFDAAGHYLQADVGFSGLAPGYAGLYQINFTVPAGLVSGNATLEVIAPDSATVEALLPVSTP
jgi:uncharacterized protein (TIGR03437 family)